MLQRRSTDRRKNDTQGKKPKQIVGTYPAFWARTTALARLGLGVRGDRSSRTNPASVARCPISDRRLMGVFKEF